MHRRVNVVKCCTFVTTTIEFLDPENVGLEVKINVSAYLEAEILQNLHFTAAILEIPICPPYRHLGKWKHGFSESLYNTLSKNV